MNISTKLRNNAKALRRTLRLSPMHKVLSKLSRRGINPGTLHALEVFGDRGENHTHDIASRVAGLDIWEIQPECEPILRQKFPQATIKITDSYEEIKRTSKKYGLVVSDNTGIAFNHFEHFDLFPAIFNVLTHPAVIILNVIPHLDTTNQEYLRQRQQFYQAADPANITFAEIEQTYRNLAAQNGWQVEWMFFERRWTFSGRKNIVYYAAIKLKRR